MAVKAPVKYLEAARQVWGKAAPEWVLALAEACDQSNQTAVARRLKCTGSQVSQVLSNKYAAKLDRFERRVRGELMNQTVNCPVLGEITMRRCVDAQGRTSAHTNELRVELRRACPRCPNRLDKEGS